MKILYLPYLSVVLQASRVHCKRFYCSSQIQDNEKEREKELQRIAENASIENPPTGCCQSGCANCVYIVWAEALAAKMKDGGPDIAQKIMDNVEDPSLKAYLELELKIRGLKK